MKLYPDCGCPPDSSGTGGLVVTCGVCRNPDCLDYGTHRRVVDGDRCNYCGVPYTLLAVDPFKGAR